MGRADAGPVRQRCRARGRRPRPHAVAHARPVASAVASGQLDPDAEDQRKLAAIRGVGEWTLAHLNLFGRGRYDVPLAKDVGMRNAYSRVAGVRTGSVTEEEFAAVLDRYAPWQGLAAIYLVAAGWRSGGRWSQSPHDLRRR